MAERELLVRIVGDDRDLQRALGNTDRRLKQIDDRTATFGRNLKSAFVAAGLTVGISEGISLANDYIDAASDLNEQISKSRQVFGQSSQAIEDWAETTASAIGVSKTAALEATGTFGNLFRVVDIGPAQAAKMSQALVQLAADLALFNNADPSDVLAAIRSGLIGEAEPLRRYGVLLSETRVQQQAVAETGKDNVKELTNQEKALARYNIILADTAPAQGDFARTSQGLANKQRIAAAEAQDLAANIGKVLAPAMDLALISTIALTGGINDLISAMGGLRQALRDTEAFDGWNQGVQNAGEGISDFFSGIGDNIPLLDETIDKVRDLRGLVRETVGGPDTPRPIQRGREGRGGIPDLPGIQAGAAKSAALAAERAAKEAKKANERRQKAFDEFIKGQGLKLDKAALTATLEDDLQVLRAVESAIQRRIAKEGRTFALAEQLTRVRSEIARTVEQQAEEAEQAGQDAFDAMIDALTLEVDIARATKPLADDQAALRALEQAILRRIRTEGETTELLRQLFDVRQEQKDVARKLADQRRERQRGIQFETLGLTDEGQERAPSQASLRRRGRSIEDQIKGTTLDTKRNRQILENAARVLSGQFGKVGREVRRAIQAMFDEIAGALEDGDKTVGPLTKTTSLNTKKFLEGLGLSEQEFNALRSRLSSFNSAGNAPGGFLSSGFNTTTGGFADPSITVNVNSTVTLDGEKVGKSVTRHQQKARRRNPRQKRGPNRRGGEG